MSDHSPQTASSILAGPELRFGEVLATITQAFSPDSERGWTEALDEAARPLFGLGEKEIGEQAACLARVLTDGLLLSADEADPHALLVGPALLSRRANPILIAALGHELASRAGISSSIGICDASHWTVVGGEGPVVLVGAGTLPKRPTTGQVRLRCPHQLAHAILISLSRLGPPAWRGRAAEMLGALPIRSCQRAASSDRTRPRAAEGEL